MDRRDVIKLLGALGLGAVGGFIAGDLVSKFSLTSKVPLSILPNYSVLVQQPQGPNGPRPMVISADGEVIVDENGRICPVSPHPCDSLHPSAFVGHCPHPRGVILSRAHGAGHQRVHGIHSHRWLTRGNGLLIYKLFISKKFK